MVSRTEWHPFDMRLRFFIGELSIGSVGIPVNRKVYSISEIAAPTSCLTLPPPDATQKGILLTRMPEGSTSSMLKNLPGRITYRLKEYRHCYIDLTGTFSEYQAKFSGKTRTTLRRKVKKFTEMAGSLDFREYKHPDEMQEFHSHARAVSTLTYQERLLDSGLPDHAGFVDKLREMATQDLVRGYLLFNKNKPVSYLYCPINDDTVEYAFLGYDPEFGKFSPGTVLQWLALERLFEEQSHKIFDFTEGESDHKLLFSTHQVLCSNTLVLEATALNRLTLGTHKLSQQVSTRLGEILDRYGLKARIKRWIRTIRWPSRWTPSRAGEK